MLNTTVRKGSRKFFDDKNFPRGFSRSGEFTVKEADILTLYGATLKALYDGSLAPEGDEESHFVEVFNHGNAVTNELERIWKKYLEKSAPREFHTLFRSSKGTVDAMDDDYVLDEEM